MFRSGPPLTKEFNAVPVDHPKVVRRERARRMWPKTERGDDDDGRKKREEEGETDGKVQLWADRQTLEFHSGEIPSVNFEPKV